MQRLTRTCSRDSLQFLHFIIFSLLYIISMHQLCFLYMLNYLCSFLLQQIKCWFQERKKEKRKKKLKNALSERERERERAAVSMLGTVFTLARLKIVPTIKNLYHIQCQSMKFSQNKASVLSPTAINHSGRLWIVFLAFGLRFCSRFLHH